MNTSHLFCFASLASPCRCALWSLLSGMPSPLSPQVWGWCNVRTQGPVSSKAEQLFLIGAWTRDTESFCWNIWVPKTHHPETLADQVQTYGHSSNRLSALCSLNLTPQLPCWNPTSKLCMYTYTHTPAVEATYLLRIHSLVSVAAGSTDMWVPMTCSSWRWAPSPATLYWSQPGGVVLGGEADMAHGLSSLTHSDFCPHIKIQPLGK